MLWLRMAAVLYSVGALQAVLAMVRRGERLGPLATHAFRIGMVLHTVSLVERSIQLNHLAANNFHETAGLCGLIVGVVFLIVDHRYRFPGLSVFIYPLVTVMAVIASTETPLGTWTNSNVRGAWLLVHIVLVLVGYAGLSFSAGAALFYLLQERRLKRRHRPARSVIDALTPDRLPPLEVLDGLITQSMSLGLVAITLAVLLVSVWASIEYGTRWVTIPQIIVSLVTWLFYLLMVFLRLSAGWRGRKAAVLSLMVLGFATLTWAAHVGLRPVLGR